jgi:hypothetical protein
LLFLECLDRALDAVSNLYGNNRLLADPGSTRELEYCDSATTDAEEFFLAVFAQRVIHSTSCNGNQAFDSIDAHDELDTGQASDLPNFSSADKDIPHLVAEYLPLRHHNRAYAFSSTAPAGVTVASLRGTRYAPIAVATTVKERKIQLSGYAIDPEFPTLKAGGDKTSILGRRRESGWWYNPHVIVVRPSKVGVSVAQIVNPDCAERLVHSIVGKSPSSTLLVLIAR